jgi:hypothetical protein
MTVTLNTDNRKVKHSNNTHLTAKPKLKDILNNNTTMTIAVEELTNFVQYCLEILNRDFSLNDPDILNFLWIYQLDFREIIINIQDDMLIERLMRYALDLDTYHSRSVLLSVENNPSALAIYNKVSAYKYYIKGLLNDANIYSRFNYFYIDKFITSSSRRFSKTIFLTLQGFKLSKVFVIFKNTHSGSINAGNFEEIKQVISSKLSHSSLIEEVNTMTYAQYTAETNIAYISYIKHFLKEGAEYSSYPMAENYAKQVQWLYTNCKKSKAIWLAKLILANYLTGNNLGIVYELDATSSGIQLVSLLIKSNQLAQLSNVIGTEYQDIYKIFSTDFKIELEKATLFLNSFIKEMQMPRIKDILQSDRITDISQAKTFGKCLQYFLYCDIETLPVLSQNISKTVSKLISNKKWKYVNIKYSADVYWMFSNKLREYSKEIPKNNTAYFIKLLLNARVVFEYLDCIHDNPWVDLSNRNLYKKPIMAHAYNMGSTGRIFHYQESLREYAYERGISRINLQSIGNLAKIIDRYFHMFEKKYLKDSNKFLGIVSL